MSVDPFETPRVPAVVERLLKQLVVTMKAVVLYPSSSSIPLENAEECAIIVREAFRDLPELRLTVLKDALAYENLPVFPGRQAFQAFAAELFQRRLAEVRFHPGVSAADIVALLGIFKIPPTQLMGAGGVESRLWELGVDSITVKEASAKIVDVQDDDVAGEDEGEVWPPDHASIRELIDGSAALRPREQRVLTRLLSDGPLVAGYLSESIAGRGTDPAVVAAGNAVSELARAAQRTPVADRAKAFEAVAAALMGLDSETRRAVIAERLLPEARSNDASAQLMRQMDMDAVCRMLVEGFGGDPGSAAGLSRAIRNLAMISLANRSEVANSAGAAMRGSGLGENVVQSVLEEALPSRLEVREHGDTGAREEQTETIMRLVDLAPGAVASQFEEAPEFLALQEEARQGISDGDIVAGLVTAVIADPSGPGFEHLMNLLEDTIDVSVERGDFIVAADAAESLRVAIDSPSVSADSRARFVSILSKMASPRDLASVAKAMRVFGEGSTEYAACERLLEALGQSILEPLLEVLAEEPEMTARKALVDMISSRSTGYIELLGRHVADSRWYFVRNVVAILGATKSPDALQYLSRTLRHADSRVRRESIRALAGLSDRLAGDMLVAALDDPDAQNVQVSARYLGAARVERARGALEQVAQGDGRGNRDLGPRVEAIEALGRLGSKQSLPVLEQLAGKRSILGSSRNRELRGAAEQAIAMIARGGGVAS